MKIVADENIPLLDQLFGQLGIVQPVPGRCIERRLLADADVLLVRSITAVTAELLEGTPVRQVATATIGADHVDQRYLRERGIGFISAPGCNARSVVEYVLSCLSVLGEAAQFNFDQISVGIIGRGQIGRRLEAALLGLGAQVLCCDPPRRAQGETGLVDLAEILRCDVVTLHVPLIREGEWPTESLVNADFLDQLKSHQILINTSRGGVVNEVALKRRLHAGDGLTVVLDVWRNEPNIDSELASLCTLATPHIAGYSLDGRAAASEIVFRELSRRLGLPVRATAAKYLPDAPLRALQFSHTAGYEEILHTAIRACYDVRCDHVHLRRALRGAEAGQAFDRLRKNYRRRRAFEHTTVEISPPPAELDMRLSAAGFSLDQT